MENQSPKATKLSYFDITNIRLTTAVMQVMVMKGSMTIDEAKLAFNETLNFMTLLLEDEPNNPHLKVITELLQEHMDNL